MTVLPVLGDYVSTYVESFILLTMKMDHLKQTCLNNGGSLKKAGEDKYKKDKNVEYLFPS